MQVPVKEEVCTASQFLAYGSSHESMLFIAAVFEYLAVSKLPWAWRCLRHHKTDRVSDSVGITSVAVVCYFPADRECLINVLLFSHSVFHSIPI